MLKRTVALFVLVFVCAFSGHGNNLWFTGYNYDGKALRKESIQTLTKRVFSTEGVDKINACVQLANKAYLSNNQALLFSTLNYAVAYCNANRAGVTDSLLYLLYNLKAERLIYVGRYVEAYEAVKNALNQVPENHIAHTFLKYNRIKILAKSIAPVNIIGLENQLNDLAASFLLIKAYTPYIETLLMLQQNFPHLYDLKKLEFQFKSLSEPYRSEGLMNLYYYTGSNKSAYLLSALAIPPNNYLSYFRLNMGMVEYYFKRDSFYLANQHLKNAYAAVCFLSDHEVNRHYAHYNNLIGEKLPKHEIAQRINVDPINYDYREQFLASKSVAADLLQEAKIEIEKERLRNQLFIKWLLLLLLVVVVLFCLVFYGFKKLRQSTTYNNWITTALSHDLRSPVSHILYALDRDNGVYLAKSNLISYEYLLDDTLNMAVYVHGNQKPVFKLIDLTELVDELLQDLNYIITNKQLVVENKLSAEMIVNGDFNGLKILLRNVLLNAIKHNKEGGYIRIESAKKEAAGLTIENSVDSKTMSSKPTAGSQIIQFFAKQNKANYQFKMESDKAVALVVFG
jgi:hypothetical protein